MADLPDYYAILEVAATATSEDIKRAYKRAALKWHPDRVPVDSPERPKRTKMFQRINDAYYTLSEPTRRRDYDEARSFSGSSGSANFDEDDADEEIPRTQPSAGGNSWANMFGFGNKAESTQSEQFGNDQFKNVFEEMMSEGDMAEDAGDTRVPNKRFWSIIGGVSGFALGFIVGDIVGAVPSAMVGSKMGSIRDAKGKSVYQVFQELPQSQRSRVLSELAAKVLSGAIS